LEMGVLWIISLCWPQPDCPPNLSFSNS
jgi:hypothetical protein